MKAEYDSSANAISIKLEDAAAPEHGDETHARAIVAVAGARPVEIQVLYPDLGVAEPLDAVAARFDLDGEALKAAAQSALAAPDRVVVVEVGDRAQV